MGNINIQFYDCYDPMPAITNTYCDVQTNQCIAKEVPNIVKQYRLIKKKDGKFQESKHINICHNCMSELNIPPCQD